MDEIDIDIDMNILLGFMGRNCSKINNNCIFL